MTSLTSEVRKYQYAMHAGDIASVLQVIPWLQKDHPGLVDITMYFVPQPWHPQSGTLAEGALAVQLADPSATVKFIMEIFNNRDEFNDDATFDLSRVGVYERMAPHAEAVGVAKDDFMAGLKQNPPGQGGVPVTKQLKFYVKHHRAAGVHVTPSVLVNGILDNSISSGWTLEQWKEHIAQLTGVEAAGASAAVQA